MFTRRRIMKGIYWAPGIIGLARIVVTFWFLIRNPLGMPLRFIQLIPMIAVIVAVFMHFKLYQDGVPVITVIAPTLIHAVVVYIFQRKIVPIPFLVILAIDIAFLSVKGVKANMFPFYIEGDDDDDLSGVEELLSDME